MSAVDRYDLRTMMAMLFTSAAIGLNIVYLQADSATGAFVGAYVLVPIFGGLVVAVSGVVEHLRRKGRDMVLINRVWAGSMVYLALSAACSALYQPRFEG